MVPIAPETAPVAQEEMVVTTSLVTAPAMPATREIHVRMVSHIKMVTSLLSRNMW